MKAIDAILQDTAKNRGEVKKLPPESDFLLKPLWTETREDREKKIREVLDSVLGIVLSRELYEKFPDADEGQLTKSRAKLANATSLAAHGRALDLGAHLVLSRGEENTGGRERSSALADAFESLLGAIFLDGGLDAAREFILRDFAADFAELALPAGIENPKGELQELMQSKSPTAPVYELISAEGPDHSRHFICSVIHEGEELARGSGKSKRAAESDAAFVALKKLQAETTFEP